ncbi:MAG: response regulator [Bacteroidota bacterium]
MDNKIKKVMVADDDPAMLDAMRMMLEFEGYEVSTSADCASILKMEAVLPDLVLLDIRLSGIDGRDICRRLKQHEKTNKIPVVLVSASKDIEHSAREAGADDFIAKPFEMNELLQKIEKIFVCRAT